MNDIRRHVFPASHPNFGTSVRLQATRFEVRDQTGLIVYSGDGVTEVNGRDSDIFVLSSLGAEDLLLSLMENMGFTPEELRERLDARQKDFAAIEALDEDPEPDFEDDDESTSED